MRADILAALTCTREDFQMLKDGSWVPDDNDDACDCSIDNVDKVKMYIEHLVSSLEDVTSCLENWVEIQDDEDAREADEEALRTANFLLKEGGE